MVLTISFQYSIHWPSFSHFTIANTDSCCQITFDSNGQSQEQAGTSEIVGINTKRIRHGNSCNKVTDWGWRLGARRYKIFTVFSTWVTRSKKINKIGLYKIKLINHHSNFHLISKMGLKTGVQEVPYFHYSDTIFLERLWE